jgi:hypothetical protein
MSDAANLIEARKLLSRLGDGAPWEWLDIFAEFRAEAVAAERARCAAEWQPIETAPRDRKIDLLLPYPRGRQIDCFWHERMKCWAKWDWPRWGPHSSKSAIENAWILLPEERCPLITWGVIPTHWRECPRPPEAIKRGDDAGRGG